MYFTCIINGHGLTDESLKKSTFESSPTLTSVRNVGNTPGVILGFSVVYPLPQNRSRVILHHLIIFLHFPECYLTTDIEVAVGYVNGIWPQLSFAATAST